MISVSDFDRSKHSNVKCVKAARLGDIESFKHYITVADDTSKIYSLFCALKFQHFNIISHYISYASRTDTYPTLRNVFYVLAYKKHNRMFIRLHQKHNSENISFTPSMIQLIFRNNKFIIKYLMDNGFEPAISNAIHRLPEVEQNDYVYKYYRNKIQCALDSGIII